MRGLDPLRMKMLKHEAKRKVWKMQRLRQKQEKE
jgi:hypothetical protein